MGMRLPIYSAPHLIRRLVRCNAYYGRITLPAYSSKSLLLYSLPKTTISYYGRLPNLYAMFYPPSLLQPALKTRLFPAPSLNKSLTPISPFPVSPLPQIRIPNPCPTLNKSLIWFFVMLFNFVSSLVPELKTRIKKYFEGYEEALPSVLEAILRRKLAGKHEETDDELMDELEVQPRDDVDDEEFESDFTNLYSTDDEEDMLSWDKLLPG